MPLRYENSYNEVWTSSLRSNIIVCHWYFVLWVLEKYLNSQLYSKAKFPLSTSLPRKTIKNKNCCNFTFSNQFLRLSSHPYQSMASNSWPSMYLKQHIAIRYWIYLTNNGNLIHYGFHILPKQEVNTFNIIEYVFSP